MNGASLLALQRTVGNAAVAGMLEQAQPAHSGSCGHQSAASAPAVQRSSFDEVLRTSGTPLAEPVRREMEARIGADFSEVRLHTGIAAQRSASEIGARAYTMGNHVVIGDGGADRHTLAHELTHVVQQRQGPVGGNDNGQGLRISSPTDDFEREAEANATRVLAGPAPVQRAVGGATAGHACEPAVQRTIGYEKGKWSQENLPPDRFAERLAKAAGELEGVHFAIPYRKLFRELEEASIRIEIDDETSFAGARAKFAIDDQTAEGGVLRISRPADDASSRELREFAATVTHEMQHALDSVTRRFKSQTPALTMKERWICSELRAFGSEAAAALKLAIGDSYLKSQGKLSAILKDVKEDRLSSERKRLALEFHFMDSHVHAGSPALSVYGSSAAIKDSELLNRLAGYLRVYKLVAGSPTNETALKWLSGNPTVEQKGLLEGVALFHQQRPQPE
ncbi:eCIS core domain-containing protein [Streptomyces sp. NBC_00669]|uniref:eCIS core domain-containing protein n=1 Tax=Streptomyces sp. NBC_00669 TaxID=2976011 RepID=UPI003FA6B8A0